MAFTKFANVEQILEVKSSNNRIDVRPGDAGAGLAKFAALNDNIQEEDGYLYVRCRAISSRVNKNNDGWPSSELESSYRTFLGRPIFVDHNNNDPGRTRGVIISSVLHKDDEEKTAALDPYYATAPDNHKPPTWIELLLEVDAKTFPKVADAIRNGDIDAVSMGANIDKSVCSVCANEAATPSDYCSHIKQKGVTFEIESANGDKVRKKAYEDCHGINFFEISAVFDPADTTALISEKVGKTADDAAPHGNAFLMNLADDAWFAIHPAHGEAAIQKSIEKGDTEKAVQAAADLSGIFSMNGYKNPYYGMQPEDIIGAVQTKMDSPQGIVSSKVAAIPADSFIEPYTPESDQSDDRNYKPQDDQVTAPQQVDTLRDEHLCPQCHADHMRTDPDGIERCPTCGYIQEPEPLNNPDLSQAKDTDLRQMNDDGTTEEGDESVPVSNDDTSQITFEPIKGVAPVTTRTTKRRTSDEGINDMNWKVQLETTSRAMVDKVLPAKAASADTTIRYADGIGFGTHVAFRNAGIEATVRYPVDGDNTNTIPGNPLKDFMLVNRAMKALGAASPADVPVKVTSSSLDEALDIIHDGGLDGKVAAKRGQQKTPLLAGDKKATDEPKNTKVVSDQLKPVEAKLMDLMSRVAALGEDMEKNADRRHIKREEREEDGAIVRSEEIVEESGDTPADQYVEEEAPEESEESTEPEAESEESVEEEEREPVAAHVDPEKKLLSIFALADDLVELGVVSREEKMAFVAKLESESDAEIEARVKMLATVKEAGLTKKPAKVASGLSRIPRLAHSGNSVVSNSNGSLDSIPDEAIFSL